jgi:hypothetical protein
MCHDGRTMIFQHDNLQAIIKGRHFRIEQGWDIFFGKELFRITTENQAKNQDKNK